MIRPAYFIAWIIALSLSLSAASGKPVRVDVVVLEYSDLPSLSEKDTDAALALAATMIRKAYGVEVEFKTTQRKDYALFLREERARIAPYRLSYFDIFEGKTAAHREDVIAACEQFGSLEQIVALLPAGDRAAVKDRATAADKLLERYDAALATIKSLKTKSDKPLVTRENWRDFSIGDLDPIFWSMDRAQPLALYLANTLIIDNALSNPAPHTMVRGIAHGVAFVASSRAIVAYQGHLLGDPRLTGYPWKLSDAGKRSAIAYTIAHEVGTHLVMNERDDYAADALVARPLPTAQEQFAHVDEWPRRKAPGKELDVMAYTYGHHLLRLKIAIARKDRAVAAKEIEALFQLKVPAEWINQAADLFDSAKWD